MDSLHHVPPLSPLSALKRPELEALLDKQSGEIVELKLPGSCWRRVALLRRALTE
jgi:hypothetical protein